MKVKASHFLLLAFSPLLLTGCGGDSVPKDLQQYVKNIKQDVEKRKNNKQLVAIKSLVPFVYQAEPLRAPFDKKDETSVNKRVYASPLQAYPLSVLKLVGTITSGGDTYAYITAPDQITYKIVPGDKIGNREGVVTSVLPGRVNVMELDSENGNSSMQRITTLELKEGQI